MDHQISSTKNLPSKNVATCRTQFALRFIQALQRIKSTTTSTTTSMKTLQQRRTRLIKLASDASMASTVGARRLWSRAVLVKIKSRARLQGLERRRRKKKKVTTMRTARSRQKRNKMKRIGKGDFGGGGGSRRRSDELRRLVPGGEGMDFCRLLGETAHYIKCLNTQVEVMQSLADAHKPS